MNALVTSVLLWSPRLDALECDAKPQPPDRERGESKERPAAGEWDPFICPDQFRQAVLAREPFKVHHLMAALAEKGLLKMHHFARTDGNLGKVSYLLTPEGVKNRAALMRDYLARKEA